MNKTNWQFYLRSDNAWHAMKEACLNARLSIDIEQYILEKDDIGSEFLEILIQKRKAGVEIRILCDMVGSYDLFSSSVPDSLRDIGIQVRFWNIVKPWRVRSYLSWFFRDHRKMLVVDKKIGFIGGVGIRGDFKIWRDTHVKVIGPVTLEMAHSFEQMWNAASIKNSTKNTPSNKNSTGDFSLVTNSPLLRKKFFYHDLVSMIRSAKSSICITTPYFIPDGKIRRALKGAAKRGVETVILIPRKSNHIWADRAGRSYFEKLLQNKVRIFRYGGEMLHAKTVVIDGVWASVGSFNIDSLSIRFNYEANVVSTNEIFAQEVMEFFREDLVLSEELQLHEWKARPARYKLMEILSLPIRRLL